MKNNLSELNDILFETLRGVKDGTIEGKKANDITNISNSIINNTKTQLAAYKLTKGVAFQDSFGKPSNKAIQSKDPYESKHEFALVKGFDSVSKAIDGMGKNEFKDQHKKWINQ